MTHFVCGASPVLRVLAWLSVLCLLFGWAVLCLSFSGFQRPASGVWLGAAHLIAFVAGISSMCPLGGISAALVVITLVVFLTISSGYASA